MTPKNEGKARAAQPTRVTPFLGSQDLIHRNNCSESTSMRVPRRFRLLPTTPFIHNIRRALFAPLELVQYLPGGPLQHLAWLRYVVFFLVVIDKPLRHELLRRCDAKSI